MSQFCDRKQKLSMQSWTISKTHMCKTKITSWQVSKNNICKKSSNNHFQKALKKIRKKKKIFIKLHCNLINEICAMWVYPTIKSIVGQAWTKKFLSTMGSIHVHLNHLSNFIFFKFILLLQLVNYFGCAALNEVP